MFTFQGSARLRRRIEQPLVSDEAALHRWRVKKSVLDGLEASIKALDKRLGKTRELVQVNKELAAARQRQKNESDEKRKVKADKQVKSLLGKVASLLADRKKNRWTFDPEGLRRRVGLIAERDRLRPEVSAVVSRMVMQEGPVPGTRHKRVGDARLLLRGNHL